LEDEDLRDALKAYVKRAVHTLASRTDGGEVPGRLVPKLTLQNSGYSVSQELVPDWGGFVVRNLFDEIEKWQEYQSLLEACIATDYTNREMEAKCNSPDAYPMMLKSLWAMSFITAYIAQVGRLRFDEEQVDIILERFRSGLTASTRELAVLAPLHNFDSERESIQLGDVKIRHLSDEEISAAYQTLWFAPFMAPMGGLDILKTRFVLEAKHSERREDPHDLSPTRKKFDIVVLMLRLQSKAGVGYAELFVKPSDSAEPARWSLGLPVRRFFGGKCSLTADDITELEALEGAFKAREKAGLEDLEEALFRFGQSYERLEWSDRLIELVIALEAMFLPDTTHEMSYRLSVRTATFLESKGDGRKNVFDIVRKAYKMRSKIIHTGGVPTSGELPGLVSQTEDIVSRAIKRIIGEHTTDSLDGICKSIDDQILQ
jgi:hypothetical protein